MNREKDELIINCANKEKCLCSKCIYGLFKWSNWKCVKFPNGKPYEVLYENENCEHFKEIISNKFNSFDKK